MKTFNSLEEIQPYYNKDTNTYNFAEKHIYFDVCFTFDLSVDSNITSCNIDARNIKALNINAWNINCRDIDAQDIDAFDIDACNINALDIYARDIDALVINARNISFMLKFFGTKSVVHMPYTLLKRRKPMW